MTFLESVEVALQTLIPLEAPGINTPLSSYPAVPQLGEMSRFTVPINTRALMRGPRFFVGAACYHRPDGVA